MSETNLAFYLTGPRETSVKESSIPVPEKDEIIIKVQASGLCVFDANLTLGNFPHERLFQNFPQVLGLDVAGVVHDVGTDVVDLKVGDRVFGHGFFGERLGGYQQFVANKGKLAAKIPDDMSFDAAASIPLNLSTAAVGLYTKENIPGRSGADLKAPWDVNGEGHYAGQPILIFSGSSSVGQYAIQLAKLSGFSPIITTASEKHTGLLKSLGATHVVSRYLSNNDTAKDISESLSGAPLSVIFDTVSSADTLQVAYAVAAKEARVIKNPSGPTAEDTEDKKLQYHNLWGSYLNEHIFGKGVAAYKAWEKYFENGQLKPNAVQVLPNGLHSVLDGFKKIASNQASGFKFVIRPQDTNSLSHV